MASMRQSRAVVWPILAKTDWINRAIGLPPVKYEIKPLPEGGLWDETEHDSQALI